jgi:hypothetical protein
MPFLTPDSYWQGDVAALRSSSPNELLATPLFVVNHEPLKARYQQWQAGRRNNMVGLVLTDYFGGIYTSEAPGVSFSPQTLEHVDGKVPHYLQIHTARSGQKGRAYASKFVIRTYAFPFGTTIRDFLPNTATNKRMSEYGNSVVVPVIQPPYTGDSLRSYMQSQGTDLTQIGEPIVAVVPFGSTAVFINGFGSNQFFVSHEVSSVQPNGDPSSDRRIVALSRLVSSNIASSPHLTQHASQTDKLLQ